MLPLLRKKDKTAFCLGQEYGIWCLASNRKQGEDVKLSLVPLFPPSLGKDAKHVLSCHFHVLFNWEVHKVPLNRKNYLNNLSKSNFCFTSKFAEVDIARCWELARVHVQQGTRNHSKHTNARVPTASLLLGCIQSLRSPLTSKINPSCSQPVRAASPHKLGALLGPWVALASPQCSRDEPCFLKHWPSSTFPVSASQGCRNRGAAGSGWWDPHARSAGPISQGAPGSMQAGTARFPLALLPPRSCTDLCIHPREQLGTSKQGRRWGASLFRGIQNLDQVKTCKHRCAVWVAKADHGESCIYLYNSPIVGTN